MTVIDIRGDGWTFWRISPRHMIHRARFEAPTTLCGLDVSQMTALPEEPPSYRIDRCLRCWVRG